MRRHLELARNGDRRATNKVIENLRPRITKMAAYYARRCGEDADDLLQEAWVALLEAIPELDMTIGSPEQYLIARARWKVLDTIKRARVRRCSPLEEESANCMDKIAPEDTVGSACVSQFEDRLNEKHRKILGCLLAGMTWRETGQLLGCTSANVAYYVRQIRQQYEEWAEEPACSI